MGAADPRAKVAALVDALRELREATAVKEAAILDEIQAVATGGKTMADKLRIIRAYVCESWAKRYESGYVYSDIENVPHLKRLLSGKDRLDAAVILERWSTFIQSHDPFYVQRRHPFLIFVRDINALVGLPLQHTDSSQSASKALEMRGQ